MQGRFALFPDLWDSVCQLKVELANCLEAFENDDFSRQGVASLSPAEKCSFTATVRAAMTNMTVRFPCPSSSLNKRLLRNRVACRDGLVDMPAVSRAYASCRLRALFDVYSFPDEFLRFSTVKEYLLLAFDGEVRRLCIVMSGMREAILFGSNAPSTRTDTPIVNRTHRITLKDVFQFINRSDFPLLWKSVLVVGAINPTTVSCEQIFSFLKHSSHINMKSSNLCSLVDYRLTVRGNDTRTTQLTRGIRND